MERKANRFYTLFHTHISIAFGWVQCQCVSILTLLPNGLALIGNDRLGIDWKGKWPDQRVGEWENGSNGFWESKHTFNVIDLFQLAFGTHSSLRCALDSLHLWNSLFQKVSIFWSVIFICKKQSPQSLFFVLLAVKIALDVPFPIVVYITGKRDLREIVSWEWESIQTKSTPWQVQVRHTVVVVGWLLTDRFLPLLRTQPVGRVEDLPCRLQPVIHHQPIVFIDSFRGASDRITFLVDCHRDETLTMWLCHPVVAARQWDRAAASWSGREMRNSVSPSICASVALENCQAAVCGVTKWNVS